MEMYSHITWLKNCHKTGNILFTLPLYFDSMDRNRGNGMWISVKDELPKKATWSGDRVLVYTEEGSIHTGMYEGEKYDEWHDKYNDSGYITHWMPLPEPPKHGE